MGNLAVSGAKMATDGVKIAMDGFLRSDVKTKAVIVGLGAIGGVYLFNKATEITKKGVEVLKDIGTTAILAGAVGTVAYFYLSAK